MGRHGTGRGQGFGGFGHHQTGFLRKYVRWWWWQGSQPSDLHRETSAGNPYGQLHTNHHPLSTGSFSPVFPGPDPIAAVIADYAAFVVPQNSKYQSWKEVIADFKKNPKSVKIAGGSVKGSMDHLVPAIAIEAAGGDPLKLVYIPYDAGGKAMAGLLSGDTQILSTGFSEAVGLAKQGEVRILAVTSEERLPQTPKVPTLMELGYDVSFANWRGFFGAPGLPDETADAYRMVLKKMYTTSDWETIRTNRGWQNLFKPGQEFYTFLEGQEKSVGDIMRKLGFLK